jgi:outer membrane protein assembly factor BamB
MGGHIPRWGLASSPVVDGPRVLITVGAPEAHLVGLDRETGAVVWRGAGSYRPGYATPVLTVLNGRPCYVVFTAEHLAAADADTGRVLWAARWRTRYDVNAASPLLVDPHHVFVASSYGRGGALFRVSGPGLDPLWRNTEIRAHFSSPVFLDGHIYGTGDPGYLMCIEPRAGRVLWRKRGFGKGGLVGVDGHLIVASGRRGDYVLVEANPEGYREKGRIRPLGGQTWVAPIVADRKLIVRNRTTLAALELP